MSTDGHHDLDTDTALLEELARLAPPPALGELPRGAQERVRAQLVAQLARPTPRRRRRAPVIAWLATAAVAAAVVVQIAPVGDGGPDTSVRRPGIPTTPSGRPTDARAVALLERVATVAASTRVPEVSADQFSYARSVVRDNTGPFGGTVRLGPAHDREVWLPEAALVPSDDLGLIREHGADVPISSAGAPWPAGLSRPTYDWLTTLPTDPTRLLERLSSEVTTSEDHDQAVFTAIGDLLRDSVVPPRTAAALYRATALIPGVTVVQGAVDLAGRPGVGVSRSDRSVRAEWIFDQDSERFLGERQWLLGDGRAQLFATTAVLERGVADRPGGPPVD